MTFNVLKNNAKDCVMWWGLVRSLCY